MPYNDYYEYFGPDYTLHIFPSNMENLNTKQELENIKTRLLENLSKLQPSPSVPFYDRPPDTEIYEEVSRGEFVRWYPGAETRVFARDGALTWWPKAQPCATADCEHLVSDHLLRAYSMQSYQQLRSAASVHKLLFCNHDLHSFSV